MHTLIAALHGWDYSTPCVHDTLSEGSDVVKHLIGSIRSRLDARSLLEDLSNHREVGLKVATNSTSDITEALEDGWLELVGKRSALS